ncbi:MAG: hypothetical protein QGH66_06515 [Dehalococcoidia bacterium]|nr:hypothetical protein [Dehalococcoidia bacterium]
MVDRYGKRFTSENLRLHCLYYGLGLFDIQRLEYPRIPCYWIFDQKRIKASALPLTIVGSAGSKQLYHWSQNNSKELASGWIISGTTVEELTRKLDRPPDALRTSVNTYNGYCEKGQDHEFKRRTLDLISLEKPLFYAVGLWPGGANAQGRPCRNTRSQTLNTDGNPISRLYGAGDLGSIYGMLYPSEGGNLAECNAFGRIAGKNAAREKPGSPGPNR